MSVEAILARLEKKAGQRVAALALELHADWRETLSQPGTGRMYGTHQASAPGEAPAVDQGVLRNAVQAVQLDPLTWAVGVAGNVKHPESGTPMSVIAPSLEYGTRTVEARPHARPTVDAFKAKRRGRV